jgi:hypothetical protein
MQPTQFVTLYWTSQNAMTADSNQVIVSFSDAPIQLSIADNSAIQVTNVPGGTLQVGGTINIGNTPQVQVTGTPTVNIGNTPTVQVTGTPTVNIGNTPSVSIASGTVNANIQNAQINSNVVNPVLPVNDAILLGTQTITATTNGSVTFNIQVPFTAALFDTFYPFLNDSVGNPVPIFSLSGWEWKCKGTIAADSFDYVTTPFVMASLNHAVMVDGITGTIGSSQILSGQKYTVTIYGAQEIQLVQSVPYRGAFADYSGSISAANTPQQVIGTFSGQALYFLFQNLSSTDMYLQFGSSWNSNVQGLKIPPSGVYELNNSSWTPLGGFPLWVKCAATGSQYTCWLGYR